MKPTKLTLSIPKDLVEQAKNYSHKVNKSLSYLVSRYFEGFSIHSKKQKIKSSISLTVQKVTGIAKSQKNESKILFEALEEKYLK